jgi:endonuclease YncB( thermonuclease family)
VHEYHCVITKIIDGDTIDVDIDLGFDCWLHKQRIRLYGIDTPESRTRYLGDLKVYDKWLCAELIKHRHAVHYLGQSKALIKQAHLDNRKLLKL